MTRPPSRTSIVNASAARNVNGPAASNSRCRNWSTCWSSSVAIRETCDFDKGWILNVFTSLSIRRVDTPAR